MKTKQKKKKRKKEKNTKTLKVRRLSYQRKTRQRKTRQRKTYKRRVYQMVGGVPSPHDDIMKRHYTDNALFVNDEGNEIQLSDIFTPSSPEIPARIVPELQNDPIRAQEIETKLNTDHNRIMEILCRSARKNNNNCLKWHRLYTSAQRQKEYNTDKLIDEMKKQIQSKNMAKVIGDLKMLQPI